MASGGVRYFKFGTVEEGSGAAGDNIPIDTDSGSALAAPSGLTNLRFYVTHFQVMVTGAGTLQFLSGASGGSDGAAKSDPIPLTTGIWVAASNNDKGHWRTNPGSPPNFHLGTGITGFAGYGSGFWDT